VHIRDRRDWEVKLGIKYKVLGTDLVNRRTCLVGSAAMPPSAPAVAHKWLTDPTLQDGAMEAVVPPTVVLRSGEYPVLPQAASRGRGRQRAKKETDQFHSYLVELGNDEPSASSMEPTRGRGLTGAP